MKAFFKYFLLATCLPGYAQRIINVSASPVTGQGQSTSPQVLVHFTLKAGLTCPGYELIHSLDSLNYLPFYTSSNVCGNQATDESFSQVHVSPGINQINYYKVNIPGFETSATYSVFVGSKAAQPGLQAYPNPIADQGTLSLKFLNYSGALVEGHIIDQNGITLQSLTVPIQQGIGMMNITNLLDGLYLIWLTDGNLLFKTKIIVKRP